ncbi:hypothetical protein EMCRGX_G022660 [Ephydatia muelleri]|eukprot:Em0017g960a
MVLLAAAVCTKQGKALLSRQFVDMTRARIEGLLAAFPKLMISGKQHTFVETENVRYVYQPLEKLYMLLITTKASNILEDLETLHLFSKVIPDYCHTLDEQDIIDNAFEVIFAFDEIIALGYRENVNLAQIRTFTEMDSHEEKIYEAMRKSQEKEARDEMKRKAKELTLAKREASKGGRGSFSGGFSGGFGSQDMRSGSSGVSAASESLLPLVSESIKSSSQPPVVSRASSGTAMKLGQKHKDVDTFVTKLEEEGQRLTPVGAPTPSTAAHTTATPTGAQLESVHLKLAEKVTLVAGKDGGVQNLEVLGILYLRITDPAFGNVVVAVKHNEEKQVQFQTHPNVNKQLFQDKQLIGLKQAGKSFPLNQDVGVLKWRLQTTEESMVPLSINCWPSENSGKCDVNIEYELLQKQLELQDVVVTIPIPAGVGSPVIGELDGEHFYDPKKHTLEWRLPVIDASNRTGSMEFTVAGLPSDFFPINVSFTSAKPYCSIEVTRVNMAEGDGAPVKFSKEVALTTDKYEIV